jgi:putative membrane protein
MVATLLAVVVLLEHIGFLVLEMFFWDKPLGQKVFKTTPSFASESRVLAANQGLYNGFLAAGLAYGLLASDPKVRSALLGFSLGCVVIAGIFGALTVSKRILFVQAVPAAAALVALLA